MCVCLCVCLCVCIDSIVSVGCLRDHLVNARTENKGRKYVMHANAAQTSTSPMQATLSHIAVRSLPPRLQWSWDPQSGPRHCGYMKAASPSLGEYALVPEWLQYEFRRGAAFAARSVEERRLSIHANAHIHTHAHTHAHAHTRTHTRTHTHTTTTTTLALHRVLRVCICHGSQRWRGTRRVGENRQSQRNRRHLLW